MANNKLKSAILIYGDFMTPNGRKYYIKIQNKSGKSVGLIPGGVNSNGEEIFIKKDSAVAGKNVVYEEYGYDEAELKRVARTWASDAGYTIEKELLDPKLLYKKRL